MPKIWGQTIDAHHRAVHSAILKATAALAAKLGLASITMSRLAEETGIGRATLYKYFADIDAVLVAWHEQQVIAHLEQLVAARDGPGDVFARLEAVLLAYVHNAHDAHGSALAALLHRGEHVSHARQHVRDFLGALLAEGLEAGVTRDDVAADELAAFCLHALAAAADLPSKAARRRLVSVILDGVRLHR